MIGLGVAGCQAASGAGTASSSVPKSSAGFSLPTDPSATLAEMSDASNHVTLVGDRAGDYVIQEERSDGTLLLAPDTSAAAIRSRLGVRQATPAEFEAFMAEHGPSMLPPDDEG